MGCGYGEDITWFATLETRDENPIPYNYNCYAVDKNKEILDTLPKLKNLHTIHRDFTEEWVLPTNIDLMLAHDSLQYSHNPLETLRYWNKQMTTNGMLIISVPSHSGIEYNKYYSRSHSYCYFHYTPVQLIYMLAVNGFDCNDAYLLKKYQDPWINIAVYKSDIAPMDPAKTSWVELCDTGLLNATVVASIQRNGYLKQEEVLYPWLDRENYFIDYVPQWTEKPEGVETVNTGVFNTSTETSEKRIRQKAAVTKETPLTSPAGVLRPPKRPYKY
jgi:SAM-dependent methyltransferase